MLEINFNTFPVLKTERLLLRQLDDRDIDAYFFFRSDPRVMQYLDRPPVQTKEEVLEFMNKVKTNFVQNEGISWTINLADNPGAMIGDVAIWRIDKTHHRGEVGYMLHPDFQGRGIMHEALSAVLRYGFEQMGLHSMEANINPENKASRRLLERCGFVQEAYFRENYYYDGRFTDSAIFSLIGREFLAR